MEYGIIEYGIPHHTTVLQASRMKEEESLKNYRLGNWVDRRLTNAKMKNFIICDTRALLNVIFSLQF